jgi:hypothetical protein
MHNLFWRYKMIVAVNANLPLMFREGSALGTCTQKLRDLISKIQGIFMKILQIILPCVFGKSKPVVAEAVSTSIQPGAQAVVTAATQVLAAPAGEVVAAPARVAADPVVLPAVEVGEVAVAPVPVAAEPVVPPAVDAGGAGVVPVPAEPVVRVAVDADGAGVVPVPAEPVVRVAVDADGAALNPVDPDGDGSGVDGNEWLDFLGGEQNPVDDESFTAPPRAEWGQRATGHDADKSPRRVLQDHESDEKEEPTATVLSPLSGEIRTIRGNRMIIAQGDRALSDEERGAGLFVTLEGLFLGWNRFAKNKKFTHEDASTVLRRGCRRYKRHLKYAKGAPISYRNVLKEHSIFELRELIGNSENLERREVTFTNYRTYLEESLAALYATARANLSDRLGALLFKGSKENPKTYGVLLSLNKETDSYSYYLMDPYGGTDGKITVHKFLSYETLISYFMQIAPVSNAQEENGYWFQPVNGFEKETPSELDELDNMLAKAAQSHASSAKRGGRPVFNEDSSTEEEDERNSGLPLAARSGATPSRVRVTANREPSEEDDDNGMPALMDFAPPPVSPSKSKKEFPVDSDEDDHQETF